MLGNFSRGMTIKIPARFQADGKPVSADNVVVRIEHYDETERNVVHDLNDTPMKQISPSDYIYEYEVPQALKEGTYLVHISAKIPQNNNRVFEAVEQFNIVSSQLSPQSNSTGQDTERVASVEELEPRTPPTINNSNDFYNNQYMNSDEKLLEDIIVDVENNPIKGVHVNVFVKHDFRPNDPNNVKVGSAISDEEGKWRLKLPVGEYAFVYKGIGFKEYREFRKV